MDPFDIISMSKDESAAVKCGTQYCIDKEEDYDLMPQFGPLKLVSVINVALRPKVERGLEPSHERQCLTKMIPFRIYRPIYICRHEGLFCLRLENFFNITFFQVYYRDIIIFNETE